MKIGKFGKIKLFHPKMCLGKKYFQVKKKKNKSAVLNADNVFVSHSGFSLASYA